MTATHNSLKKSLSLLKPPSRLLLSRSFSTTQTPVPEPSDQQSQTPELKKPSILDFDVAAKHCRDQVKKFDFYSYIVGQQFPAPLQPYYFGVNAYFLEALRSREISKEMSICQTRLMWWEQSLLDVTDKGKPAREPVTRVLQEAVKKTPLNAKLLQRIVNYQLFDIDRGDIQSMRELEIYAENTRSLLLYMNLHLLRIDSPDALSAASHLGRCIGICDVIKKIPFYLAKHRDIQVLVNEKYSITCSLIKYGIQGERASSQRSSLMSYLRLRHMLRSILKCIYTYSMSTSGRSTTQRSPTRCTEQPKMILTELTLICGISSESIRFLMRSTSPPDEVTGRYQLVIFLLGFTFFFSFIGRYTIRNINTANASVNIAKQSDVLRNEPLNNMMQLPNKGPRMHPIDCPALYIPLSKSVSTSSSTVRAPVSSLNLSAIGSYISWKEPILVNAPPTPVKNIPVMVIHSLFGNISLNRQLGPMHHVASPYTTKFKHIIRVVVGALYASKNLCTKSEVGIKPIIYTEQIRLVISGVRLKSSSSLISRVVSWNVQRPMQRAALRKPKRVRAEVKRVKQPIFGTLADTIWQINW